MVQLLKNASEESGLTLGDLSERSGVAVSRLSYFLRGKRTLTLPAAETLCEALGYTLTKADPPAPRKKRGAPSDN